MNTIRLNSILIVAAALCGSRLALGARADDSSSGIAFSDPSKPGTLRIRVSHGEVAVHGAEVKAITVKSGSTTPVNSAPRKDGLRVLSASAELRPDRKGPTWPRSSTGTTAPAVRRPDFEVTVLPRYTAIIVFN